MQILGIPSNTSVSIGLTKDYHYWKLIGRAMKFKNVTGPWQRCILICPALKTLNE